MSFLKNLFEKTKDHKYGKGHRLGDTSEAKKIQSSEPISLKSNNEAAQKAAEAAIQRLQNNNTPRPSTSNSASAKKEIIEQNNEMKKVLELKDHYFGKPKLVEDVPLLKKNRIWYKSQLLLPNQRFTKEDIENQIEQRILEQVESEPILASVTLLLTANYSQSDKLNKCKELLNKMSDNILNNPNDDKYKRIRVENKIFNENVLSLKYSQFVLTNVGFKPRKLPLKDDEPDIKEDFFVFDNDVNVRNLEELKSALVLSEPVLPELDRDIKIFKPSASNSKKIYNLSEEYDLQDFYNVKIEDLLKEQQIRNDALEKQGILRTKAMRERDEQIELRRYNFCLIRVKFPDDYILEAVFKSQETLSDLYDLVRENLEHGGLIFELVGPSLKKSATPSSSLAEAGLAPASLLYFKICDSIEQRQIADLVAKTNSYLKLT